jgi:hypothetical protein
MCGRCSAYPTALKIDERKYFAVLGKRINLPAIYKIIE